MSEELKEKAKENKTVRFTTSVDLVQHPMSNAKSKSKKQYYLTLEYFVKDKVADEYAVSRLEQYRKQFLKNKVIGEKDSRIENIVHTIIKNNQSQRRYKYWLMCDTALILMEDSLIEQVSEQMQKFMTNPQRKKFGILLQALKGDDKTDYTSVAFAKGLIQQFRKNYNFFKKPMQRYIVTANMSAGKSTLINALIGKPLTRTSQEVCTGNKCYLYNKPFEDGCIHLKNDTYTINASFDDLADISWEYETNIASFFRGMDEMKYRLCIIDTPGVNSAVNRNHKKISRKALKEESYEKVLYILNANKLGTEEEIAHLKWISENVRKDKIIFILNKLDDFHAADDNISMSLDKVKNDLALIGFQNPIICPISAYFALLIKRKSYGDKLTDDELDAYSLYVKKFRKPVYDLSKYYNGIQIESSDSEALEMSKRCGLYGLEKILFGGTV